MTTLIHGGDIYSAHPHEREQLHDFSANINPLGIPKSVRDAAAYSLAQCIHYPDPLCRELTAAIAKRESVPPSLVCCGNGAADLIYRLVYGLRPATGMVLAPTFAEYELALRAAGANVIYHMLAHDKLFCLDASILSQIREQNPALLFLCNPNNPTGQTIERELLLSILQCCKETGTVLVVDECFCDFLDEAQSYTLVPFLDEWDNLVILKAFTKMYAIPGLRIGYSLCSSADIRERMMGAGQAWSVSVPAQYAGVAAAQDCEWPPKTRQYLRQQRRLLQDGLSQAGFTVWPPRANYIFFQTPKELSIDWKGEFRKRGILIRSCSNYHGLDEHYFRIAVKGEEENRYFLATLREIISKRRGM